MNRILAVAFLALVGLMPARDRSAQTTLYLRTLAEDLLCAEPVCQAQLLTATVDPPAVRSVVDIDDRAPATYIFPDGSLTAGLRDSSTDRSAIVVRSTATGATAAVPAPRAVTLLGNPTRPEVYFNDAQGPMAATFSGLRRLTPPPCAAATGSQVISVSADGRRVAYSSCGVHVLDTLTGAIVGSLQDTSHGALSLDGSSFYRVVATRVQRLDVATGAVLAEVERGPEVPSTPVVDTRTGAVLVTYFEASGGVVHDANLQFSYSGLLPYGQWSFDPHRSRAYVLARRRDGMPPTTFESVRVIDTASWAELLNVPLAGGGPRASMVATFVPAAPDTLAAQVSGNAVALSWGVGGPAAAVTRHVLEVGSAPGLSDIFSGLDVGLQTSFGASNVPPGTYYVRVRAGNYSGLGAPSNEVAVRVP